MPGPVTVDVLISALDAAGDGFAIYDVVPTAPGLPARFLLRFINEAGAGGQDPARLVGSEVGELLLGEAGVIVRRALEAVADGGPPQVLRLGIDQSPWAGSYDVTVAAADPAVLVVVWRDVTRQLQAQADLELAYHETAAMRVLLQTALDSTSDAFAVYRVERDEQRAVTGTRLMVINQAGARPLDDDPEALLGQDLRDFFPGAVSSGLWDVLLQAVEEDRVLHHRVDVPDADGAWQASFDNTVAPTADDMVVVTWRDVSATVRHTRELSALHAEVAHAATHDELTGLATRTLLLRNIEDALQAADRDGARVGLVFVDLDHFKEVNDSLGHIAGDALLRSVASTLQSLVRAGDCVARYGGDEFVILLADLPVDWTPDAFLARLVERLRRPVLLDRTSVTPSASVGVALCPPVDADVDALLQRADLAMYDSKRAGRGCVSVAAEPAGSVRLVLS